MRTLLALRCALSALLASLRSLLTLTFGSFLTALRSLAFGFVLVLSTFLIIPFLLHLSSFEAQWFDTAE
jgi:hypothetical protein